MSTHDDWEWAEAAELADMAADEATERQRKTEAELATLRTQLAERDRLIEEAERLLSKWNADKSMGVGPCAFCYRNAGEHRKDCEAAAWLTRASEVLGRQEGK